MTDQKSTYLPSVYTTEHLRGIAASLPDILRDLCLYVIDNHAFQVTPGGSKHHCYPGGLLDHTTEVVKTCETMSGPGVDRHVLLTAAVWHDLHKIYEYRAESNGHIVKLPYFHLVGHVAGSYREFSSMSMARGLNYQTAQNIEHCILAHHGRREWGSPVAPCTMEAYILHSADMLSSQSWYD